MEPHAVIYPPNRQMEKITKFSNVPSMFDYLLFLDINDQGETILGSSNISGTYWNGTLFCYKEPDIELNKYYGYYNTITSIPCGKSIKDTNHVLIAEDGKYLKLLTLPKDDGIIQCEDYYMTQDRIDEISVGKKSNKYIYACLGNTVAVWDIENSSKLTLLRKYKNFHSGDITSIDTSYDHVNLVASCSTDRKACILDDRIENSATVLYANEFCSLTSIVWHPEYPHILMVGSTAGDIYLLDKREPGEFLSVIHCMDNKIFRMSFNKDTYLAVCGDVPYLQVYKCTNANITNVYTSCQHIDIIRGISWHRNTLYSCGFDRKIAKHTITM